MSEQDLETLSVLIAAKLGREPAAKPPPEPPSSAKKKSQRQIQYLTPEELERLFGAIREEGSVRDLAIFELAYHRGLRASEVGRLRIGHVRIEAKRLYVERLKNGNPGEYILTDREVKALRPFLKRRGPHAGPLFKSRKGGAISRSRLDQLMKHYGAAAELPEEKRHFHCLRHSCATSLLNHPDHPQDLAAIKDHLGHRSVTSTEVYAQMLSSRRDEIGEALKGKF